MLPLFLKCNAFQANIFVLGIYGDFIFIDVPSNCTNIYDLTTSIVGGRETEKMSRLAENFSNVQ